MSPIASETSALVVVDVQNDFCPGGALAVTEGDQVVPVINRLSALFALSVATQDWHPAGHDSFASSHAGREPMEVITLGGIEQVLWPDHCVQGSSGADFHPELDMRPFRLIVRKGTNPKLDSYSGFFENDHTTATGLEYYLKGMGIVDLYVCGLATDYCVLFTARDAASVGFRVHVVEDACRGVGFPEGSVQKALAELRDRGVELLRSGGLGV
jgi:nicotinamidase/pyrazinamidase